MHVSRIVKVAHCLVPIFAVWLSPFVAMNCAALAQADREAASQSSLVVEPPIAGTWKYFFDIQHPAISSEECASLADAVARARTDSPDAALEGLVREEKYFRDLAAKGGRAKSGSNPLTTFIVASENHFYERCDSRGGWSEQGGSGHSFQILRDGGDVMWQRGDSSDPAGKAQPFFVNDVRGKQGASDSALAREIKQHVIAINYCGRKGRCQDGEATWIVPRDAYEAEPPFGLAILFVADSMLMRRSVQGPRVSFSIALFDRSGRTCKEWRSEWLDGRPRHLEERELFSAGPTINTVRSLRVVEYSEQGKVPDVMELAMTPFERREARDHRLFGAPKFDPVTAKIESVGDRESDLRNNSAPASGKKFEAETSIDGALGESVALDVHGRQESSARDLVAIPVHSMPETRGEIPVLMLGGAVLGLSVAIWLFLRWRRSASGPGVAALLLGLSTGGLQSCGDPPVQVVYNNIDAAVSTFGVPVEAVPSVLRMASPLSPGQIQRHELYIVNNLEEEIKIDHVLPSCGCVRVDAQEASGRIAPFGSLACQIWVEMDAFVRVDMTVSWRRKALNATAETLVIPMRIAADSATSARLAALPDTSPR